jgi:hypothetical protein
MRWLIGLFVLIPAVSTAQSVDPLQKARPGQQVWITAEKGSRFTGMLESVTPDLVRLADGSQVARAAILRLEVADGVREGALAGAAIGGAVGLFAGPLCVEKHACTWVPNLIAAGAGAALGALIDRRTPRKTLYQRRGTWTPSITLSGTSAGIAFTLRR